MIRAGLIAAIIMAGLAVFAWSITQTNNSLIRAEINAATNCASKVK